ncbi:MAG: sialate O-acetylesterase [Verrucomicrobia bacterium]|nr:sialate O-acetylesterase [Verrucomicrobiota bacterium]
MAPLRCTRRPRARGVIASWLVVAFALALPLPAKPLKVFILAGQSNMEGHAKVETFDHLADDPATLPLLRQMCDAEGRPRVSDRVWISYFTGRGEANGEGLGRLTVGFGSRPDPAKDGGKIGPEFTFGLTMEAALAEPILLIKTAWGGKSLHTDFRPPGAGPFVFNETHLANLQKGGRPIAEVRAKQAADTGRYFRLMVEHVRKVLAHPRRVCPAFAQANLKLLAAPLR